MEIEEHSAVKEQLCVQGSRRFKMIQNILCNPPALFFLVALLILTLCCPLLVLYMKLTNELPDFDNMKIWNSFLGNLPYSEFCEGTSNGFNNRITSSSVGVKLQFLVHSNTFNNQSLHYLTFHGTGKDLGTKIKNNNNQRIDSNISVSFQLDISRGHCNTTWCPVNTCALITVPSHTPNFNALSPSMCKECLCNKPRFNQNSTNMVLSGGYQCEPIVKPVNEKYRRHGLITIYLSNKEKKKAETNLYKTTILFAGLSVLFLIGMACSSHSRIQLKHTD